MLGYGFSIPENDADTFALALSPSQSALTTSTRDENETARLPEGESTAAEHAPGEGDHPGKTSRGYAINGVWV